MVCITLLLPYLNVFWDEVLIAVKQSQEHNNLRRESSQKPLNNGRTRLLKKLFLQIGVTYERGI